MNSAATLLVVSAVVVALIDWIVIGADMRIVQYVAKPAVMLLLFLAVLLIDIEGLGDSTSSARSLFALAIVFSMLGDVTLMMPSQRFEAALAAFLLSHIAQITGFSLIRIERGVPLVGALTIVGFIVVTVGVVWLGRGIIRGASDEDEAFRVGITVYTAVISLMVVSAYAARVDIMIGGALLLYVSDAILGWSRYVRPIRKGRVLTMITYHIAHVLLVIGLTSI